VRQLSLPCFKTAIRGQAKRRVAILARPCFGEWRWRCLVTYLTPRLVAPSNRPPLSVRPIRVLRRPCLASNGLIDSVCCYCNFAYSNSGVCLADVCSLLAIDSRIRTCSPRHYPSSLSELGTHSSIKDPSPHPISRLISGNAHKSMAWCCLFVTSLIMPGFELI